MTQFIGCGCPSRQTLSSCRDSPSRQSRWYELTSDCLSLPCNIVVSLPHHSHTLSSASLTSLSTLTPYSLCLPLAPPHSCHTPSHFITLTSPPHLTYHHTHSISHTLPLPCSTPSLEPLSQTTVMTATFSLASQRKNPHSAVVSSSLLMSSLCRPGHSGGGALCWTKTIPSLAQRAESCFSHIGGIGQ